MMDFQSLSWRQQKSSILPLAASLCVERYGLTLKGIDKGCGEGNNFSYVVEAWEGKYQIRVFSPSSPYDRVRSLHWYLTQLQQESGLTVPEAIAGIDGEFIQQVTPEPAYGGFHCCIVDEWIEADHLEDLSADPRLPSIIEKLGARLAKMHSHSRDVSLPEWFTLPARGEQALQRWLQRLRTEPVQGLHIDFDSYKDHTVDQLIAWAEELRGWMVERGEGPDLFGIIHGDFNTGNVLFKDAEPCLIDFDPLCYGYFDLDLIKMLDFGVPPQYHANFLSGYASIRPLPADLEDALGILRRARASVPNWY